MRACFKSFLENLGKTKLKGEHVMLQYYFFFCLSTIFLTSPGGTQSFHTMFTIIRILYAHNTTDQISGSFWPYVIFYLSPNTVEPQSLSFWSLNLVIHPYFCPSHCLFSLPFPTPNFLLSAWLPTSCLCSSSSACWFVSSNNLCNILAI